MIKDMISHLRGNPDNNRETPHYLHSHLDETARQAMSFAAEFNSGEWGKVLGLAHDAGKGRSDWQQYIRKKSSYSKDEEFSKEIAQKIPHAIHGAKLVEELFGKEIGRALAYCIAGHHAGLPDWSPAEGAGRSSLSYQLQSLQDIKDIDVEIVKKVEESRPIAPPWKFEPGLDFSLWIRMLYSSLVDADFLDTERYMNIEQAAQRGGYCTMSELLKRFNNYMKKLDERAENTLVNNIRRRIRQKCIAMASQPQGIYSLSVPTGGGKTLSSLAFALQHAVEHDLKRIIYVIPFTSILEQNANVFRSVVGAEQVIEHHSGLNEDPTDLRSRLAAENWDAPLIVTTSVQFFESLFAAKSSRCRKLHNIVKSVVVLDEAQLVPVEYLNPILEVMQILVQHYNVTFVISTATQPAFGENKSVGKGYKGLKGITEIMGDRNEIEQIYKSLKRVSVELPEDLDTVSSWESIADELKKYKQVLCIVSDRKSCRELHRIMPEGTIHLSALMCGEHRSRVIELIKVKLKQQETVRVISTQLVEAGVDFDFPVVYRALAGLDSIVQAAGRCNREGKLTGMGKVVVFNPPRKAPIGLLRKAADTTRSLLSAGIKDPLDYSLFEKYFSELYWKANSLDAQDIISLLSPRQELSIFFRTAAERFKIIDDSMQRTIIVRYGDSEQLIEQLRKAGIDRALLRKLQRYTVNVHINEFNHLLRRAAIEEIRPGIYALVSKVDYHPDIGLLVDENCYDPEQFII